MTNNPDKLLVELVDALAVDHAIGILLAAQMGATPQEIQLVVQSADYNEETQAVTSQQGYIIRCIGVQEHRFSVGMFNRLVVVDDHPLLWNHNAQYKQIYFSGHCEDVDGLMLELNQIYGQHYGIVRSLADDINRMAALGTILGRGNGLLGEMPEPMADLVKTLLERYDYNVNLLDAELEKSPIPFKLLVLDDSYVIAQMYSVDYLKTR